MCVSEIINEFSAFTHLSNSATELVKQELLFVGQESGKLVAIRDIIRKVYLASVTIFRLSPEIQNLHH